ncbi:MAG: hypothetical protein ABEH43_09500 [Flavobacteriales bacterium]
MSKNTCDYCNSPAEYSDPIKKNPWERKNKNVFFCSKECEMALRSNLKPWRRVVAGKYITGMTGVIFLLLITITVSFNVGNDTAQCISIMCISIPLFIASYHGFKNPFIYYMLTGNMIKQIKMKRFIRSQKNVAIGLSVLGVLMIIFGGLAFLEVEIVYSIIRG